MSETIPQNETDMRFDAQNIRRCRDYVRSLQKQLDKAVENNDRAKIRWFMYLLLWRWAKRRHPNKRKSCIMRKYFTTYGRKWQFKTEAGETLINVSKIPITRFVKIKSGMRVHNGDKETIEYWKKREYTNALNQIYSVKIEKLFKRQKGMCIYCGQPITNTEIEKGTVHVHHLVPRSQGGTEKLNDLRLVP